MENAVKELDASVVERSGTYQDLIKTIFVEQKYLVSKLLIFIEGYGDYQINDEGQFSQAKSYIKSDLKIKFSFEYLHQAAITEKLDFFIKISKEYSSFLEEY